MSKEKQIYDLIIIGAGPAGLTAGIYASRLGLKTLLLDASAPGGRAMEASVIDNFPGFPEGPTGKDLVEKMKAHLAKFGAEIKLFEETTSLKLSGELKEVFTREATYFCWALIIATGTQRKKLRVPGEVEFLGKGVSYCSVCDGPFFKGLKVAIVGHEAEAVSDALYMAELAKEVLLVTHEKPLEDGSLPERRLMEKPNVEVVNGKVEAILGEAAVNAVKIAEFQTGREFQREVNGVFISLGGVPTTQIVKKAGVDVDPKGCIKVDRTQRTNVEGVFAAGDCTCGGMQIVTATGEGAMAAMKASAYLKIRKKGA